jgi:hypothetical protein
VGGGFSVGVRDFIGLAEKSGNGYFVIAINTGSRDSTVQAQAICGTKPAGTRSVRTTGAGVKAAEAAKLAALRRQFAAG